MRAVRFAEHGGTDVLSVDDIDRPEITDTELMVEILAASVNPVDTYFREGAYQPYALPMTPGVDFAGVVAETGNGVTGFDPGDRVYGYGIGSDHQGSYAEYAAVPDDRVVHLPDDVGFAEAAAAGTVAVTAWRALVDLADLEPTETCLVHGGSGGVGHAAVQIAAAAGAHVFTTAAPKYHDSLVGLGADVVFDYDRDDLEEAVKGAATDGVDVVLDHRLDDYLQFDINVAATGGRVVGIGENDQTVSLSAVGLGRSNDVSVHLMSAFNIPNFRVPLRRVADLMASGDLSVRVARRYDLTVADAREAQRAVMEESVFGKLVIEP